MRSNKERARAESFLTRRLHDAVLTGKADGLEPVSRRNVIGTAIGIAVALLIVGGAVLWGHFRPGPGAPLDQDTAVAVEKETGTRYLVDDGTLRPVANRASVLLLAGADAKVQVVSRERTDRMPRGRPVGIPGAPEDLPAPGALTLSGWQSCVTLVPPEDGAAPAAPQLSFGPPAPALPDSRGVLVSGDSGAVYLVVGDRRYGVASAAVRNALGYATVQPVPVPDAWLAALAPGRPLAPPTVDGVGGAGPPVGGEPTAVGQILVRPHSTGTPDYFLVRARDIVVITPMERALLLADPRITALDPLRPEAPVTAPATLAEVSPADPEGTAGWPSEPPAPVTDESQVCLAGDATGGRWLSAPPPADTAPGGPAVSVPPGSAVLAEMTGPGGARTGLHLLVDDLGRACPVADADSLAALGYQQVTPLPLPQALVSMIPEGPVLGIAAARGTATG